MQQRADRLHDPLLQRLGVAARHRVALRQQPPGVRRVQQAGVHRGGVVDGQAGTVHQLSGRL